MEYIIVSSKDIQSLINMVNKKMDDGYTPLGNITAEYNGYIANTNYHQAMVKWNIT